MCVTVSDLEVGIRFIYFSKIKKKTKRSREIFLLHPPVLSNLNKTDALPEIKRLPQNPPEEP